MRTEAEIETQFWKALQGDRTVMLGLAGVDDGHSQPMTAQLLEEHQETGGPVWFFTSADTEFFKAVGSSHRAVMHFSSKGHDLFAAVDGEILPVSDRTVIDRLWNKFIAAWFPGGKEDPKLRLLRFDGERAQIWLNENSALAGVKILLGRDPKKEYAGKTADVRLDSPRH